MKEKGEARNRGSNGNETRENGKDRGSKRERERETEAARCNLMETTLSAQVLTQTRGTFCSV